MTDEKINQFYYQQFTRLFEKPYRKWQIENGNQLKNMITYHKGKNKRYWKSNLLRECSNKEQLDQIPLLLDVKDLLAQAKALDKDGHYQRVAKGILEQCNYNDVYLQNDSDKAEEIRFIFSSVKSDTSVDLKTSLIFCDFFRINSILIIFSSNLN